MRYMDDSEEDYITALDVRTLEMDADMFATTQSIWYLLFLILKFDSQVKCEGMKPMDLFYWWSFAIRSHFLLCEDRFADTKKFTDRMKHLPSNARWGMIADTVIEIIDKMIDPNVFKLDEVKKKFIDGAIEAEKVFNELKYTHYSWIDELNKNKQYVHYRNQVNSNWEIVVKQLKKYNRCPLFGE